jgi:hypothetical protein
MFKNQQQKLFQLGMLWKPQPHPCILENYFIIYLMLTQLIAFHSYF